MSDTLTTALEKSAQPKEARTVIDYIDRNEADFVAKLPEGQSFAYFKAALLTEMRRNGGALWKVDPASVALAFAATLQLGVPPGPLGLSYLVPFKNECVMILGYKGMVDLFYRHPQAKDIVTGVVHKGDAFEWREGTRPFLDHTPSGPPAEREWTHAYAVARLKTGGTVFRVIFPEDVAKAQARSANAKHPASPWQTDYFAMVRKTAVRRLAPMLPQSPAFAQALQADEVPIDATAGPLTGGEDDGNP